MSPTSNGLPYTGEQRDVGVPHESTLWVVIAARGLATLASRPASTRERADELAREYADAYGGLPGVTVTLEERHSVVTIVRRDVVT